MWMKKFKFHHFPSISSFLLDPQYPNPNFSNTHLPKSTILPLQPHNPHFHPPLIIPFSRPFSSSIPTTNLVDTASEDEEPDEILEIPRKPTKKLDPELLQQVETIMTSLQDFSSDSAHARDLLEACGIPISPNLVSEVLSRLQNDWGPAFTFFLWAGTHPDYSHTVRDYHSMISILGKRRRFDTAWSLVEEMRKKSLVTPKTLMIVIRKYCAAHEVSKAINVFYTFKKFGFALGLEEFQGLLSALCRYKNVSDAEHLLLCNEKAFSFETKSFNIVLNGWCNILVVVREAKRFWRQMEMMGIDKDVVSYGSMISCCSKAANINVVMKLYNHMKEEGIVLKGNVSKKPRIFSRRWRRMVLLRTLSRFL